MSVRLCIFSNCTDDVLTRPTILETYKSWVDTFGEPENLSVYVDPNPNTHFLKPYKTLLKEKLGIEPIITKGLADGYYRAVQDNSEDYLFMAEHDWTMQMVAHSLDEIIQIMADNNLWYMRFNKRKNDNSIDGTKWQTYFKPTDKPYCLTDNISNNQHIINRKYYKENILTLIDRNVPEAGLIEQVLQRRYEGAVYGAYNHPPTIVHLDGRGKRKKRVK